MPSIAIIGQRLNIHGSSSARELWAHGNMEGLCQLAKEQVAQGAIALDIALGKNSSCLQQLAQCVDVPLFLDSADSRELTAGLKAVPGRIHANALSGRHPESVRTAVGNLAKQLGVQVVIQALGPGKPAQRADEKVGWAERLMEEITTKTALPADQILVDLTVLPLSPPENRDAARQALEAVEIWRARFPHIRTLLGISNISFGLPESERPLLDRLFLDYCAQVGLDYGLADPALLSPGRQIPKNQRAALEQRLFPR